jgi:mono/diheme cytochrome c family protein
MIGQSMIRTLAGVILITAGFSAHAQTARTVLDGVYTAAQATRGEKAYTASCASCHRDTLEGGAEALSLKGERFMESWRDDTLEGVFLHMKTRMPRRPAGEPGSLPEQSYVDILAYILKANDFPAGNTELTPAGVGSTLLVGKDGPKPLPANAQVQAVGCLTAGANDTWTLATASEAARARNAEEITADEVKNAAPRPLGSREFRLQNLEDLRAGFTPASLKGHKVLAKGVLTRQAKNERIYVTSIESLAPDCGR